MKCSIYGGVVLTLVSLLSAGNAAIATEAEQVHFEIGASVDRFDYREFDTQGDELLNETGLLPGLSFEIGKDTPGFTQTFRIGLSANTVDYDGQTQSGTPLMADTYERITDFQFVLQAKSESVAGIVPGVLLGLGYREWRRDIQPTSITARLLETYRWKYLQLGMFAYWRTNAHWQFGVEASVLRPLNPTIEANIAGYDAITLDLNSENSFRVALPVQFRYSEAVSWVISPYWQSWNLGRSETRRLRINGVLTSNSATEPESKTNVWGIALRAHFD